MRINHNIAALNTYRQLTGNTASTGKSLEKLSSGLRINKAGDDAAGLAISEKMRGQIRGLDQAGRNSQDGISLIQTAEGALNETHSILQRMRELAVQSANDTNTSADRVNVQQEIDQLNTEIDRIATTTQFNTKNLLDGSMGSAVTTAVNNLNSNLALATGTVAATTVANLASYGGGAGSLGIVSGDSIQISYNKGTTSVSNAAFTATGAFTVSDVIATITDVGVAYSGTAASGVVLSATTAGTTGAVHGITIIVKDSSGVVKAGATNALSSFGETLAAKNTRADGSATFQIGSNTNQNMNLSIETMDTNALGVASLKVGNQGQANVAIKVIDTATQKVSTERSKLGSVQNRLEHTINNLGTSSENLTAAESRVRDVDMAKEMMEFTKNNILSQAAQAMLAQANQQPQGVLQLLR